MRIKVEVHGGFDRGFRKAEVPFDKTASCSCGEKLGVVEGLDEEGDYVYVIVCPQEEDE